MYPVIVLVGGKGTRLRSITRGEIPKCLVEVAGKSFLEWKLDSLQHLGFTDITLAVSHMGHQFVKRYKGKHGVIWDDGSGVEPYFFREVLHPHWVTYGDALTYGNYLAMEASSTHATNILAYQHIDAGMTLRLPRPAGGIRFWDTPWEPHHINTPEDLARTEEYLRGNLVGLR